MAKFITVTFLLLFSFNSWCQNNADKLNDLQKALDKLQYSVGEGDNVDHRKIKELIVSLKTIKYERDSLSMLVNVLQAELLLSQGKLGHCKTMLSKSDLPPIDAADNYSAVDIHDLSKKSTRIKKGLYVVIASERNQKEIGKILKKMKTQFSNKDLMIVQNKIKTWFHICLKKSYSSVEIGNKVYEIRGKGYKDAWSMELN